jgi:hypothetical protein
MVYLNSLLPTASTKVSGTCANDRNAMMLHVEVPGYEWYTIGLFYARLCSSDAGECNVHESDHASLGASALYSSCTAFKKSIIFEIS